MGFEAGLRSREVCNCKSRVKVEFAEIGMELQIWETEKLGNPILRQMLLIAEIPARMPMCLQSVVSSS